MGKNNKWSALQQHGILMHTIRKWCTKFGFRAPDVVVAYVASRTAALLRRGERDTRTEKWDSAGLIRNLISAQSLTNPNGVKPEDFSIWSSILRIWSTWGSSINYVTRIISIFLVSLFSFSFLSPSFLSLFPLSFFTHTRTFHTFLFCSCLRSCLRRLVFHRFAMTSLAFGELASFKANACLYSDLCYTFDFFGRRIMSQVLSD